VLFIDASKEFIAGKNLNKLGEKHIKNIITTYEQFTERTLQTGVIEGKYSYVATPQEIAENDYNLKISCYVDTFEEESEIDISAVQGEMNRLEEELKVVQSEINLYLKKLMTI
jgi:type I restriction enzyme M protein